MDGEKITYKDIEEYEILFTLAPSFLLERFAKKKTNIVLKFESKTKEYIAHLNEVQRNKLDIILNMDIDEIQELMSEAYAHTHKKQYKILANPKYSEFIEINLRELDNLIKKEK